MVIKGSPTNLKIFAIYRKTIIMRTLCKNVVIQGLETLAYVTCTEVAPTSQNAVLLGKACLHHSLGGPALSKKQFVVSLLEQLL